jgi:hypothetical protein
MATLDPSVPLINGTTYTLTIGGQSFDFQTVFNKKKRELNHDYMDSNDIIRYTDYTGSEHYTNYITYDDPGPDNQWFTTDDRLYLFAEQELDSSNNVIFNRVYDANSTLQSYTTYSYSNGRLINSANYRDIDGSGNDGVLGTNDDVPNNFYIFEYSSGEHQVLGFDSVGADGIAFTADDNQITLTRTIINADSSIAQRYSFSDAGSDNTWGTDDDTVSLGEQLEYNADGNLITSKEIVDNGADGTLFTQDDSINFVLFWEYSGLQRSSGGSIASSGADSIWLTGDDEIRSTKEYAYNEQGQRTLYRHIYFGNDGQLGTDDDRILEVEREFDANGFATVEYFRLINYYDQSLGFPREILSTTTEFDTSY